MPPHQFCKPGTAKAKRLNDSFPSCSCCGAPKPAKPSRRRAPPPIVEDLVCATVQTCLWEQYPEIQSYPIAINKYYRDPSNKLVGHTRTREESPEALPLSLWHLGHLPKLPRASFIHLVQIMPSATPAPTTWSFNPENFTLPTLSGHLLAVGENPHQHLFFHRNCACSWHAPAYISGGPPLDER